MKEIRIEVVHGGVGTDWRKLPTDMVFTQVYNLLKFTELYI